jgi:hypothetical protein
LDNSIVSNFGALAEPTLTEPVAELLLIDTSRPVANVGKLPAPLVHVPLVKTCHETVLPMSGPYFSESWFAVSFFALTC